MGEVKATNDFIDKVIDLVSIIYIIFTCVCIYHIL